MSDLPSPPDVYGVRSNDNRAPVLLVGQSPNAYVERNPCAVLRPDLSGSQHAANRLRDLWNLTTLEFLRSVDRCNLWPTAKGTPIVLGRERVAALVRADRALDRPIILLGRRVAEAFGLKEADWFSWHDHVGLADGTLARNVGVHPHPAGLSRVWSDQSQAIRSSAFWVEALKRAGLTD